VAAASGCGGGCRHFFFHCRLPLRESENFYDKIRAWIQFFYIL